MCTTISACLTSRRLDEPITPVTSSLRWPCSLRVLCFSGISVLPKAKLNYLLLLHWRNFLGVKSEFIWVDSGAAGLAGDAGCMTKPTKKAMQSNSLNPSPPAYVEVKLASWVNYPVISVVMMPSKCQSISWNPALVETWNVRRFYLTSASHVQGGWQKMHLEYWPIAGEYPGGK